MYALLAVEEEERCQNQGGVANKDAQRHRETTGSARRWKIVVTKWCIHYLKKNLVQGESRRKGCSFHWVSHDP
jgi:hypothetical protein